MTEKHPYDFDLRLDDPVSTHALQFRMIPTGARVLDIGCHTGILGEALRTRKQCFVTGIDNDSEALRAATLRLNATVQLDLEQRGWTQRIMETGGKEFDIVLFGDVIEHTRDPLAEFQYLREAAGETPMLLLDDVFSELDEGRANQLLEMAASGNLGQTFITATEGARFEAIASQSSESRIFRMKQGVIE